MWPSTFYLFISKIWNTDRNVPSIFWDDYFPLFPYELYSNVVFFHSKIVCSTYDSNNYSKRLFLDVRLIILPVAHFIYHDILLLLFDIFFYNDFYKQAFMKRESGGLSACLPACVHFFELYTQCVWSESSSGLDGCITKPISKLVLQM